MAYSRMASGSLRAYDHSSAAHQQLLHLAGGVQLGRRLHTVAQDGGRPAAAAQACAEHDRCPFARGVLHVVYPRHAVQRGDQSRHDQRRQSQYRQGRHQGPHELPQVLQHPADYINTDCRLGRGRVDANLPHIF